MFVQGLRRFSCVFVAVTVCSYDILCSHIADPSATVQASSSSVQKTKLNGDWVDPGDMLATDLSSFETSMDTKDKQAKAKEENAKKAGISAEPSQKLMYNVESRLREMTSNPPRNCELPYFKQLTRIMIESLERPGKHYATIELTEKDLETLNDFRDKDMDGERIYDVLDIVSSIFSQVNEDVNNSLTFWSRALLAVEYNKEIYAVLFIVVTIVLILLVFERHTSMSWLQQFWYFLAVLFIISIPWEWFRLYRKEFAKKQSEMIKRLPPHCSPNNMTISQSVSLWMSNLLTWREDECAKHQEAILVDPVWEVSPSQAFSITATRFFAKPLEYIADACGRSLNAFFLHIPVQWQPFMFIVIVILFLLCILLISKSRIKFGFFEIGPTVLPPKRLQGDELAAIEERVGKLIQERVQKELREIKNVQGQVRKELREFTQERRHEELPRIPAAHDEKIEAAVNHGVQERESAVYDLPIKENRSC